MKRRLVAVAFLLLSCVKHAPSSAPLADGDARLSRGVAPLAYSLMLDVDPAKDGFSGEIRIKVKLDAPKSRIVMHARDLEITAKGARVETGKNGGIALVFGRTLSAGEHEISLAFTGKYPESLSGLYIAGKDEQRAAYTQFEAVDARRAFPCFDEPRFKTPWDVTLRVPHGLVAVANTPELSRSREGDRDVLRFARSKPLPTYLVAVAVGRFDIVEGTRVDGIPVRVIAPKGMGADAGYALSRVGPVLRVLTEYFGRPYPYEKIDLVAVPDFWAGAMENAGLITFRDSLLLRDESKIDSQQKISLENVLAHELAHQWFGNLVTMEWWDDIWLNEGFASWMDSKVAARTMPESEPEIGDVRSSRAVMAVDAKASARVVRQPISSGADIFNIFDGITFTKGQAVLRMVEAWTGEAEFREGVRLYLKENEWGNATTDDLFAALEKTTGKPVRAVAQTFLDRPGTPLLDVSVRCEGEAAFATIAQSRWVGEGSKVEQTGPWRVPACFRLGRADGTSRKQCFVVENPHTEVKLDACPAWIHPNADEAGYYRWSLPEKDLAALLATKLSAAEEAAMPSNLGALLRSGRLDGGAWLDSVAKLASSSRRQTVEGATGAAALAREIAATDDDEKSAQDLARFVAKTFGARAKALGLEPKKREPLDDELLRADLAWTLADAGRDRELRAQARRLADAWLADPRSVSAPAARIAVPLAAIEGDAALHARLVEKLRSTNDLSDRDILVDTLASFRDPALIEASLELWKADLFRKNEWETLAFSPQRGDREVVLRWLEKNYDLIVSKTSEDVIAELPRLGGERCDEKGRDAWKAFFTKERLKPGQERSLANTLEVIDECIRLRASHGEAIRRRLAATGTN